MPSNTRPASSSSAPPVAAPHAGMSDEELWLRFAERDCQASLNMLHRRYFEPLHAWIRRCGVHDEARAADLFQDLWVRLVNNRFRFDPAMKWGTWAFHIAKNLARNEGRRLQRRVVTPEGDFRLVDDESLQVRTAVSSSAPEAMMRERQLQARLQRAVAELSEEQRRIFTLRFIDGRSNEEVAKLLKIPLGALKGKAKRVRLSVLETMRPWLEPP